MFRLLHSNLYQWYRMVHTVNSSYRYRYIHACMHTKQTHVHMIKKYAHAHIWKNMYAHIGNG